MIKTATSYMFAFLLGVMFFFGVMAESDAVWLTAKEIKNGAFSFNGIVYNVTKDNDWCLHNPTMRDIILQYYFLCFTGFVGDYEV